MGNFLLHGLVGIVTTIIIIALSVFVILGLIKMTTHATEERRIIDKERILDEKEKIRTQGGIVDTSITSAQLRKELRHPEKALPKETQTGLFHGAHAAGKKN